MSKGRVLIADDNHEIVRLIQINLDFEDYESLIAYDGEVALSLARRELPDLIILDLLLPRMDGWTVLKELKSDETTRHIPVVLITGASIKDRQERELVNDVVDYISKPFNPLRLLEIVEENVQKSRSLRPAHRVPVEEKERRLILVGGGKDTTSLLQFLLGDPRIKILRYIPSGDSAEADELARKFNIVVVKGEHRSIDLDGADLVLDTREEPDARLQQRARKLGVEIMSGNSLRFFWEVLSAGEASRRKEWTLVEELNERVRELSILSEIGDIAASTINRWEVLEKILKLSSKASQVNACAILIYDEEKEKFVISNSQGLNEKFCDKLLLSLSDPLVEELLTMKRPLVLGDIGRSFPSPLLLQCLKENLRSLVMVPLTVKDKIIGIILAFSDRKNPFGEEQAALLYTLGGQAGILLENANLYDASKQKQVLVEQLLAKVIQAQEEERKLIAADIHDTVAQTLVGMLAKVQMAQSLLDMDLEQARQLLEELKKIVGDSVKEVRQIIFNLRPTSLDDLGLLPSLENFIKRFEREQQIKVELICNTRERRLPATLETNIFRIVQESLNNIKKHADAKKAWVSFRFSPTNLSLRIADDGKGFNWNEVTEKFLKGESHGLEGMKERAALMGGSTKIDTQQGKGTVVSVEIPLPRREEHEREEEA
jgi:signal transduction histidine kinase/DNA-binding response OmpR family regulator